MVAPSSLSLSLSVVAADSTTAAGGGLTARPYITTCTNSPRERWWVGVGVGGVARRARARDSGRAIEKTLG